MGDFSFFSCQGWESGVLTSLGCGGQAHTESQGFAGEGAH